MSLVYNKPVLNQFDNMPVTEFAMVLAQIDNWCSLKIVGFWKQILKHCETGLY